MRHTSQVSRGAPRQTGGVISRTQSSGLRTAIAPPAWRGRSTPLYADRATPRRLKSGTYAGTRINARGWEADEFFVGGIKQVVDSEEDLAVLAECPVHSEINAGVGV